MPVSAQPQHHTQSRHSVSPARPDHANVQPAPAWDPLLTQQQAWGNQALQRQLRTRALQAKLTVNQPGDPYEQEADRVAEQVMRLPELIAQAGSVTHRLGQPSAQPTTTKLQSSNSSSLVLQRKCACGSSSGLSGKCEACQHKQLLGLPLQTKLRINEPGDQYEQEADRVAEQVMRMPELNLKGENPSLSATPLVQRKVVSGKAGIGEAPPIVHDVLSSPGKPLDAETCAFFEPRFGYDFGNVRIHADTRAAESARALHAQAFTVGSNIVFGTGQHTPGTTYGRRLLAHELTHVMQQQGSGAFLWAQGGRVPGDTASERHADKIGAAGTHGTGSGVSGARSDGTVEQGVEQAEVTRWNAGVRGNSGKGRLNFLHTQYTPGSMAGRRLMAHELTHVAQQNSTTASSKGSSGSDGVKPFKALSTTLFNARENNVIQRSEGGGGEGGNRSVRSNDCFIQTSQDPPAGWPELQKQARTLCDDYNKSGTFRNKAAAQYQIKKGEGVYSTAVVPFHSGRVGALSFRDTIRRELRVIPSSWNAKPDDSSAIGPIRINQSRHYENQQGQKALTRRKALSAHNEQVMTNVGADISAQSSVQKVTGYIYTFYAPCNVCQLALQRTHLNERSIAWFVDSQCVGEENGSGFNPSKPPASNPLERGQEIGPEDTNFTSALRLKNAAGDPLDQADATTWTKYKIAQEREDQKEDPTETKQDAQTPEATPQLAWQDQLIEQWLPNQQTVPVPAGSTYGINISAPVYKAKPPSAVVSSNLWTAGAPALGVTQGLLPNYLPDPAFEQAREVVRVPGSGSSRSTEASISGRQHPTVSSGNSPTVAAPESAKSHSSWMWPPQRVSVPQGQSGMPLVRSPDPQLPVLWEPRTGSPAGRQAPAPLPIHEPITVPSGRAPVSGETPLLTGPTAESPALPSTARPLSGEAGAAVGLGAALVVEALAHRWSDYVTAREREKAEKRVRDFWPSLSREMEEHPNTGVVIYVAMSQPKQGGAATFRFADFELVPGSTFGEAKQFRVNRGGYAPPQATEEIIINYQWLPPLVSGRTELSEVWTAKDIGAGWLGQKLDEWWWWLTND